MTLDILIPTIRPERIAGMIGNINENTSPKIPFGIIFIAEFGNNAVVREVQRLKEKNRNVHVIFNALERGYPGSMNTAFHWSNADVVFLGSDDVVHHKDWAERGLAAFAPGVGIVGTNDLDDKGVLAGEHSTHSFVKRDYVMNPGAVIGAPGWLMYQGYRHYYTDVELIATAKARQAFKPCMDSIVEHRRIESEMDETWLVRRQEMLVHDMPIYQRRVALWNGERKHYGK